MTELFEEFEVNREPRSKSLARTTVLSLAVHGVFIMLVLYGPTVHAFWQLASMVTGAEYADEAYERGAVRERAVMISPHEKLYYPPGYLNPTLPPAPDAQVVEEPTPTPTPRPRPTPKPRPTPAPTPDAASEVADKDKPGDDSALSDEEKKAKAEQEAKEREALDRVAEQNKVKLPPKINSRPFKDMLVKWNGEYEKGRLNLNGTIAVTLEADRNEDGTLTNMVMTGGSASDPALKELAKDVVATLSASRALEFLQGSRHLKLRLVLDRQKLNITVNTEMDSAERASSMANVYGLGIIGMRWKKAGTDEGAAWKNTRVSAQDKTIVVTFDMPRETAGSMLARQVGKAREGQQ
ncbi:MAG TPA: hypothetical protein VF240_10320 [Pyrinomonadaceae bacterium]